MLTVAGINILGTIALVSAVGVESKAAMNSAKTMTKLESRGLKLPKLFYVTPEGQAIPSEAYRYVDPKDLKGTSKIKREMKIPARDGEEKSDVTYISYDKFDTPSPGKLQAPRKASIRLEFKTKQIRDKIEVPKENYNKGEKDELIAKSEDKYGKGGATQAITWSEIKVDKITYLDKAYKFLSIMNTVKSADKTAERSTPPCTQERSSGVAGSVAECEDIINTR
jgi:hypothetical protein